MAFCSITISQGSHSALIVNLNPEVSFPRYSSLTPNSPFSSTSMSVSEHELQKGPSFS
mgnify:CR=1 FL=1